VGHDTFQIHHLDAMIGVTKGAGLLMETPWSHLPMVTGAAGSGYSARKSITS
jgi:hypothetical protein